VTFIKPSTVGAVDQVTDEQPRDRWKRPLIHVPGKDKLVAYTRCTTFIDVIEDKTNLQKWGKRMVLVGATKAPDIVRQAAPLDPSDKDDKATLNVLAEKLVTIAGAHEKREQGTHLHGLSEYVDRDEPLPECSEQDRRDMAAYMLATMNLGEVVAAERLVVVDEIKVAGTPDRVRHYDGPGPGAFMTAKEKAAGGGAAYYPDWITGNLITDLKTGSVEYGALKMAMQLATYSRGVFYDWRTQERTPLPDVRQDWGLIMHLPSGSGVCEVYWIDLTLGWEAVQVAKAVRELRSKRKVMVLLSGDVNLTPAA
jgi:hypothetical protein